MKHPTLRALDNEIADYISQVPIWIWIVILIVFALILCCQQENGKDLEAKDRLYKLESDERIRSAIRGWKSSEEISEITKKPDAPS